MKKGLVCIISLLLIVSIGVNVFLGYKYFNNDINDNEDDNYIIKYNNKTISNEDLIKKYGDSLSDDIIDSIVNDILYSDLNEDELKEANSETNDTIDELKAMYGDELENTVKVYTNYSLSEYETNLKIYNGFKYRVNCKDNCEALVYSKQKDVLEDIKIKFNDDRLEKAWNNKLKQFDSYINSAKEVEENKYTSKEGDYLKEISINNGLEEMINGNMKFVLVISRSDCSHCVSYKPKLNKILSENRIYGYYIDMDLADSKTVSIINKLYEANGTPTTIIVSNNTVHDIMVGDKSDSQIKEFLTKNGIII